MAKIYQGLLGPVIGRAGTGVGYLWKGIPCMRAYRSEINYPNTPLQQRERDWFVSMVRFASRATAALKLGLRQVAEQSSMTEGNWFVKRNKRCFNTINGQLSVDYEHLQIASGPAADVFFKSPRFELNETVVIDFEKNSLARHASGSDKVYCYFYAPDLQRGFLAAPVERRAKSLRVALPQAWAGREVRVYGFVIDREGRASNSTYVGVGRLNHTEYEGRYIPLSDSWKEFVQLASGNADAPHTDTVQPRDEAPRHVDLFSDLDRTPPPE